MKIFNDNDYSCLASCHCGIQRDPTLAEIVEQNTCFQTCNLMCGQVINPVDQSACYNTCACSCNKVCIEGCDGADDENLCKLKWGWNSKSEPFDNVVAEPATETSPAAVVSTPAPVETSQTAPVAQIVPTPEATPISEPVTKAAPVSEPVIQVPPASVPDSTPASQVASPPATVTTPLVTSTPDLVVATPSTSSLSSVSAALPSLPEVTLPSPQEAGAAVVDKAKDLLPESTPTLPEVSTPVVDSAVQKAKDVAASLPNLASKMNFLEAEVDSGNFTTSKCTSLCVSQCIGKPKDKAAAINCLADCGCYEEYSSIEMMQAPEARLIGHSGSVSLLGYLILFIFLTGVILYTGFLVIERDEKKKKVQNFDEENSQSLLYQRL